LAHAPLSGAGAARFGGRFNPAGVPALYLSEDLETAVAEYQQDIGLRPGTFCAFDVSLTHTLDLSNAEARAVVGVAAEDLACPWRELLLVDKVTPPSWTLARRLIEQDCAAIRVPSTRRSGGVNLVVWRWNDIPERRIIALDPNEDLAPL
jgi:RES domain-containing protein